MFAFIHSPLPLNQDCEAMLGKKTRAVDSVLHEKSHFAGLISHSPSCSLFFSIQERKCARCLRMRLFGFRQVAVMKVALASARTFSSAKIQAATTCDLPREDSSLPRTAIFFPTGTG
jgi:hypothetical protein